MRNTLPPVEEQERPRFERKKRVSVNTYQEGWIEWRKKKDGSKAFRIRYRIRDDSSPSGWKKAARPWQEGSSKKAAGRALDEWMKQINEHPPLAPTKVSITLAEYKDGLWTTWRKDGIKASTRYGHESMWKRHIEPALGKMKISEINPTDITIFFDGLVSKGLSAKTRVNMYQFIRLMFQVALEHELIQASPIRPKLHRPEYKAQKMLIWTPQNVAAVLSQIPEVYQTLFWCLALTSGRIGEVLGLRRGDIDLRNRTIKFSDNLWRGDLQGSTKTDEVYEKYIPDSLLGRLSDYLSQRDLQSGDFVFYRSQFDRRPIDPDYLRREVLYPALQRAGIKREKRASGFHAFRRALGKAVRKQSGIEMASVQLSHKSMVTTDEHYNDRDRDDLIAAAQLAEQVLAVCPQQ
jgi:integrase